MNDIFENFLINPDISLIPNYRISPFSSKDIFLNSKLPFSDKIDEYFRNRLNNRNYIYTENGRTALFIAIKELDLKKTDVITIITTTNNHYISGCVTQEIEKFCSWSRKVEANTKAILVNHEFGFAYKNLSVLKKYNIPIIEDCAHCFMSNNEENTVGKIGDFLIFSFPKFFPIQAGGLLAYNPKYTVTNNLNIQFERYLKNTLSYYIDDIGKWSKKRVDNFNFMSKLFNSINMKQRFLLDEITVPGVFLFRIPNKIDENNLKNFLWQNGVQNSALYKEKTLYIPVHHKLGKDDMIFIFKLIEFYLKYQLM